MFATDDEDQGFDPASTVFDETGILYAHTVFDPLAIIAADGSVQPYLAQSITPNADYTAWTITMRPGVVFHDGTPCDAAAVLGSFEHFVHGEFGFTTSPIAKMSVTGPLTVEVNLHQPWVPFDYYLTGGIGAQMAYILAPAMIKNPHGTSHPIGTGPFVFEDWVPNDHFSATRNPHYWRSGMPYLDAIEFRPIPNEQSRADSLRAGNVNIIHTPSAQTILQFRDDMQYSYIDDAGRVVGEPDMNFILLNMDSPPLNDIRVRQAMAMAISGPQYARIIDSSVDAPSNGPFVPGTPYYVDPGYPAYNPAKARRLVEQVRHEIGKPVAINLGGTNAPNSTRDAEYLQAQLQAVGMEVTLSSWQEAQYINNALSGSNFQAYYWTQFAAVDPDLNYVFWSPTTVSPTLSVNMARNTDPAVEVALQQGRRSSDPSVRAAAYQQVSRLFARDLPYIWTDRAVWAVVAEPSVKNFDTATTPDGGAALGMIVGTIWLAQIWLSS
ncbi:MAG: ABC transporter substrate-binding protein [Acidimicrobiales bacterium]